MGERLSEPCNTIGVNAGVNHLTNSSLKCKNILWGNTNIGAAAWGK